MTTTTAPRDQSLGRALAPFLRKYGVVIALVLLLVVAAIWTPTFFSGTTMRNTARQASFIGLVTIGQFLVLMVRGIDLSIPAVIGFTAVLVAERGPGTVQGIALALALAVAIGAVNAFLVVRRKVPAFVATFGMFVAIDGLRLVYTKGSASGAVSEGLVSLGRGSFLGITFSTWTWIILLIVVSLFLYRTPHGRRMVMVGANPQMATLSGIRTGRYILAAFIASSVLAVVTAVFIAGSSGYVDRFIGIGTDLDSITAALIGGARFGGGEGSLLGSAVGALLLASLLTVIVLLGWSPEVQLIAKGVVLIAAIALQS
ncbi:MAG: ABC transporter permease, partial [bacterium]|nr:ABC transporter permease [bacterium]